jgi:hypothetical protein
MGTKQIRMQHTELQAPVELSEWQAFVRSADPEVAFQDYLTLFEGPARFTITDELNRIVDDFRPASRDAVYAVLGEEIYALWIDPLHNYLAVVCTKASGDPEDATLIMCYGKDGPDLPRESPGGAAAPAEPDPVRDDDGRPPDPMLDLSDMDRFHRAAASGELADILTQMARRAPK